MMCLLALVKRNQSDLILIVESGSTKADWIIINDNGIDQSFTTEGLNPYSNKDSIKVIKSTIKTELSFKNIKSVYFYGAGMVGTRTLNSFAEAFQDLTSGHVEVNDDLIAAARVTCGDDPGIVCILGTGSNIGFYDGDAITKKVMSGGYLLGGEGSGMALGKELIKMYMRDQLPEATDQKLEASYEITKDNIIDKVYSQNVPNRFLASFAPFINELEATEKKVITDKVFLEFLNERILKLKVDQKYPIHFVGSIAYSFSKEIEDMLKNHNLELGKIVHKPIHNLVNYHLMSN